MNATLRKSAISVIVAGLLINIGFIFFGYDHYIYFLESCFSPDGHISCPYCAVLKVTGCLCLLLFVAIVVFNQTFLKRIGRVQVSNIRRSSIFFMLVALCLGLCWYFLRDFSFLYTEDGIFESLTVLCLLSASLIWIKCIRSAKYSNIQICFCFLFVLSLVFAMEEISWGQRIFGWKTPKVWAAINYQNETNIHNLLNPLLYYIYPVSCFLLGWLLISGRSWVIRFNKHGINGRLRHLFPRVEGVYWGICFILMSLALIIIYTTSELVEELFAVFLLSYSLELSNSASLMKRPFSSGRFADGG